MAGLPTIPEEAAALEQGVPGTDYWADRIAMASPGRVAAGGMGGGMGEPVGAPPVPPPPGSELMPEEEESQGGIADVIAYLRQLLGGGGR